MKKRYLTSDDESVLFLTDSHKALRYLNNSKIMRIHLPGIKISEEPRKEDFLVEYIDKEEKSLEYDFPNRRIKLSGKFGGDIHRHDLSFLLFPLFTRLHEEKGRYSFHSGAVSHGGRGALFIAGGCEGKSTLVTELGLEGMRYISGERTLVEKGKDIIAGTELISNRLGCVRDYFPDIEIEDNYGKSTNPYEIKVVSRPEKLGIERAKLPVELKRIYFLSLHKNFDFSVYQSSKVKYLNKLLENLSPRIRATRSMVMDFEEPVISFDDRSLAKKRLNTVKEIIDNLEIKSIRGNLSKVSKYVERDLEDILD